MRYKFLWLTLVLGVVAVSAQTLTLQACYEKAQAHHPLLEEKQQRERVYELNRKSINSRYLPEVSVSANAMYNSNVVEFSKVLENLPLPMDLSSINLSEMPKDQYKATINVNQILYDGGVIHFSRELEKAALAADKSTTEVDMYKIYDQINQVYFSLLLMDKQNELALMFRDQVTEQKAVLQSSVDNGVVLATTLDALDAELLKITQQLDEIAITQNQLKSTLATLIGESVTDVSLQLPIVESISGDEIVRPELNLFSAQKLRLQTAQKLTGKTLFPKLAAFGTYGYGNPPGNDFFTDEFDTYYTVGAGLSWTPFDWRRTARQKQTLKAQQNMLNARQENFERGIHIMMDASKTEIAKTEKLLQTDEQLITLRERMSKTAASQLQNGDITSTAYLTELNQERQALIYFEMHTIRLSQAKVNYKTISGQILREN